MKRLLLAIALICASVTPSFAKVHTLQVTLGASATQVTVGNITCKWVVFQNNSADVMRLGDENVTASVGMSVSSGGSFFTPPASPQGYTTNLHDWYVFGTASDKLDIVYDDGQ